jgi:LmbE family N-acetylglucosaminyl deacetylase
MLPLTVGLPPRAPLTVLCLGAHADDLEIGCAGTLLTLLQARSNVRVHWIVFSGSETRAQEARRSARRLLSGARSIDIRVESFRDGFLPQEWSAVKDVFEQLKPIEPDLIFTHALHDRHQDHRTIAELTWNTFRGHTVLEYEIPKYDGDLGHPNIFVPLSGRILHRKVRLLMSAFPSQLSKTWYSPETFEGLMRIRGIECAAREGYAEAFHGRKLTLQLDVGRG